MEVIREKYFYVLHCYQEAHRYQEAYCCQEELHCHDANDYPKDAVIQADFVSEPIPMYGTDTVGQGMFSSELEKTILARDMELLGVESVDKACKNILANKEIVSRLLKVGLLEYREEELQKITAVHWI